MEFMSKVQAWFITAFGAIGAGIVKLFGGWSQDIKTLIILMIVDFAMGLLIAGVFKKSTKTEKGAMSSNECFKGLCKKGCMLLFVLVGNQLDKVLGLDYIRTAVIIAFIANETISIIENAGIMGIPIPKALTKAIEILKSKTDEEE